MMVEDALNRFKKSMNELNRDSMDSGLLENMYHQKITFIDPVHQIDGFDNIKAYFKDLYQNVSYIHFDFVRDSSLDNKITVEWIMTCCHPKLNGGKNYRVNGCSLLEIEDGKIRWQRDYYDLGEMLYEKIPLLGKLIRKLKERLQ